MCKLNLIFAQWRRDDITAGHNGHTEKEQEESKRVVRERQGGHNKEARALKADGAYLHILPQWEGPCVHL